jgi:hypothetical protein
MMTTDDDKGPCPYPQPVESKSHSLFHVLLRDGLSSLDFCLSQSSKPCTISKYIFMHSSSPCFVVLYLIPLVKYVSQDSAVGIATSYGLDDRGFGVRVPVVSRIFSSSCSPDRLWGPPNLLSNGYRGLFLRR